MDYDYTRNLLPPKDETEDCGGGFPAALTVIAAGLTILLLVIFSAVAAFAQSSESTAISGANSEVEVTTGAAAGAAINNYGQKPGKDGKTYTEVATAPSLGGLALGGGHPCAYSPATAQISIIGGGAGIGGSKVDSACMLMVMGAAGDAKAYKAAQIMLASRDPAACRAMEAAGMVTCASSKTKRTSASATAKVANGKCELNGRKLTFRVSTGGDRDSELAACKAKYGL